MKKTVKVFKFGGASLKDVEAIKNVVHILDRYRDEQLIIVVSAMGKTTDALERVVMAHNEGHTETARRLLQDIKTAHDQIIAGLFDQGDDVYAAVNDLFVESEWVLDEPPHEHYDFMYDQIIGVGELVSSRIMAALLNRQGMPCQWLDARDVILTDDIYREGWVQWDETEARYARKVPAMLEQPGFILTQGFIGSTAENFTTTLGREGSDYTAAIFSYLSDADSMTIWKDVPGILTADPRIFENVVKLDRLSYREAIEMTYYGARVIHPKTIKPLQNKSIPLMVKSFVDPDGEGTLISDEIEDAYPPIVTIEEKQALMQISTRDFSFVAEHHISQLFSLIADQRLQVNMMQNSAISFSVCVNDIDDKVDRFIQQIDKDFKVILDRNLRLITLRHYTEGVLQNLLGGKIVMLEERSRGTVQAVVKDLPVINWKHQS
jgi:aspartate kinase